MQLVAAGSRAIVLLCKNYANREDFVARYSYRLWLRNEFRVTDMSGNVWEWLSDMFQSGQDIVDISDLDVEEDDVPSYNMMIMKGGGLVKARE